MTSNAELDTAAAAGDRDQARVLLVEDDDGDALLVEELLPRRGRAGRRPARAVPRPGQGHGRRGGLRAARPGPAGLPRPAGIAAAAGARAGGGHRGADREANEYLGEQAVRAGAQDYLVKGEVAGHMLHRVIRYAVERRRAEEAQRDLRVAQVRAEENARLERGLLPSPLLADSRLSVAARCRRAASSTCSAGTSTTWWRRPTAGCTPLSATSAGAARLRPRSASACGWPGARWCWLAGPPTRSWPPSASCSGTSGRTTPCSPPCAWCR